MWLWCPVLEKPVAPKFYEPKTGLMKINKRNSDVTYKVHDLSTTSKQIDHFDRLRKAAIKPRRHFLSKCEPEKLITSESDSDILLPDAATRKVHKSTARNAPNQTEKREISQATNNRNG